MKKNKTEKLPYKILGTTQPEEPLFVRKLNDGDVGMVVGKLGTRIVVQFKARGVFAIAENLKDDSFEFIIQSQYNKTTMEEILAQRKKNEDTEAKQTNEENASQPENEKIKKEKHAATADGDKVEIRSGLNQLTEKKLLSIAKKFKVDVAKYDHLNGGLKKMSIVNSTLGAIMVAIKTGKNTKNEIIGLM